VIRYADGGILDSDPKAEAVCFSRNVSVDLLLKYTRCKNPEDRHK
jgi:hypothetical protein